MSSLRRLVTAEKEASEHERDFSVVSDEMLVHQRDLTEVFDRLALNLVDGDQHSVVGFLHAV